ncbi:hypothetical protein IMZ48_40585, partial [Candidatus Bathyarchaeota archaeon]|nr:hypothetical protein [Candidatus Bathyarchaeota archaeon]
MESHMFAERLAGPAGPGVRVLWRGAPPKLGRVSNDTVLMRRSSAAKHSVHDTNGWLNTVGTTLGKKLQIKLHAHSATPRDNLDDAHHKTTPRLTMAPKQDNAPQKAAKRKEPPSSTSSRPASTTPAARFPKRPKFQDARQI